MSEEFYGQVKKYPRPEELGTARDPRFLDVKRVAAVDMAYYNHVHDEVTGKCVKNRYGTRCEPKKK